MTAKIGIKPDNAQAARHDPTMTGSAQVRCPSCNEWVKLTWYPQPSVPISKLKELRHNIDSYAFSQLEKLIDKAEKGG